MNLRESWNLLRGAPVSSRPEALTGQPVTPAKRPENLRWGLQTGLSIGHTRSWPMESPLARAVVEGSGLGRYRQDLGLPENVTAFVTALLQHANRASATATARPGRLLLGLIGAGVETNRRKAPRAFCLLALAGGHCSKEEPPTQPETAKPDDQDLHAQGNGVFTEIAQDSSQAAGTAVLHRLLEALHLVAVKNLRRKQEQATMLCAKLGMAV